MFFNFDKSLGLETIKKESDLTFELLYFDLEVRVFKWLTRIDTFMTVMTAVKKNKRGTNKDH